LLDQLKSTLDDLQLFSSGDLPAHPAASMVYTVVAPLRQERINAADHVVVNS